MTRLRALAITALLIAITRGAAQAGEPEALLVIKNHRFEPAELKVRSSQRIKLVVHNRDSTPEEFESHSLNRESLFPLRGQGNDLHRPAQARLLRLLRRVRRSRSHRPHIRRYGRWRPPVAKATHSRSPPMANNERAG
jgi:hypothetical protein